MSVITPNQINKETDFVSGALLLINKPPEWTSFDVVKKVRNLIKKKLQIKKIKVGHAGTLDPLATGLLIVCTGKFTKRIDEIKGQAKVEMLPEYEVLIDHQSVGGGVALFFIIAEN